MRIFSFIFLCLTILMIPVVIGYGIIGIHYVFGQGTPTTPNTLTPNLQFQPQKAVIYVEPTTGQFQAVPLQQQSSSAIGMGEATGIIGIISGIAAGVWAKMSGSKDNKQTNAAVLQGMNVDSELAKYIDKISDPAKVLAAEGTSPAVKLATLEKNKDDFADKAVKA